MSSTRKRELIQAAFVLFLPTTLSPLLEAQSSVPFIIGQTPGAARNNTSGWFGMQFTVGGASMTVTDVGRLCMAGNGGTHIVALNLTNRVTLSMAGCTPGNYVYGRMPSGVVLNPNSVNTVFSQEFAGGDSWGDWGQVKSTTDATVNGLAYNLSDGNSSTFYSGAGYSYGPVNVFYTSYVAPPTIALTSPAPNATVSGVVNVTSNAQAAPGRTIASVAYSVGVVFDFVPPLDTTKLTDGSYSIGANATDSAGVRAAPAFETINTVNSLPAIPFVTSQSPGLPRNNTSGWFGMQFTTGIRPFTVTKIGRMCLSGNSGLHQLLLLSNFTGTQETAMVSMTGCTPGTYVYGYLSRPLLLRSNTSYQLASLETAGGDTWSDWGTVTTTPDAAVNGLAYWLNTNLAYVQSNPPALVSSPNYSYIPVNFTYGGTFPSASPPQVSISAPQAFATLTGTANVTSTVTFNSSPIQYTRYFVDNSLFKPPLNTAAIPNGNHTLQVQVGDSQGLTGIGQQSVYSINGSASYMMASVPTSALRNNTTGWFGMQFTTGGQHIYVTQLGRACVATGQEYTRTLRLYMFASPAFLLGSATITNPAVCTTQFIYGNLSGAADLPPNTPFVLLSSTETAGGPSWHDWGMVNPKPQGVSDGLSITGLAWSLGQYPPTIPLQVGDGVTQSFPSFSTSPGANYTFVGLDLAYYVAQVR